jgi:hypothetical protein
MKGIQKVDNTMEAMKRNNLENIRIKIGTIIIHHHTYAKSEHYNVLQRVARSKRTWLKEKVKNPLLYIP